MKPVHVRYILTCEDTKENQNNTVDFLGVFESISFKELPTKKDFSLVFSMGYHVKPNESKEITIRILDPSNVAIAKDFVFDLLDENNNNDDDKVSVTLTTIRLPDFPIKLSGFYHFQVIHEENVISEHVVLFIKEGEE